MKSRILVVDDQHYVLDVFKIFLEDEGYEVIPADNYESAVLVLSSVHVDLIISDIIMGRKTGLDLLQTVKESGLRCPVIMVTGAPDLDTAVASVRLGAFDYIGKPIDREALLKTVRHALQLKALDDEKQRTNRHLEAIFASVQEGIFSVDVNMVITQANDALEQFFLFQADKLIGKNIQEIGAASVKACIEIIKNTIITREAIREHRTEFKGKDNKKMLVVINCSPLFDLDNTFIGAVVVLRDISRIAALEQKLHTRESFHKIIGKSQEMQEIYSLIETLADTNTTVLITGESGTGKELAASAIHYCGSRAQKPFIKVNSAALAESLLESELFGHVAGAFTGATKDKIGRFQMADGGTIFLDEIGGISLALQLKLLRVLQEKEFERVGDARAIKVDVRVIAATNSNLPDEIKLGRFREDLYYRLNVIEIHMPPLRQRTEDIPLLVSYFCSKFNRKFHKNIMGVSDRVMHLFVNYPWPGNIRELQNVLERAFILCDEENITTDHIFLKPRAKSVLGDIREELHQPISKLKLLKVLEMARWNRTKAAAMLGISRRTFYRKIKDLNLIKSE